MNGMPFFVFVLEGTNVRGTAGNRVRFILEKKKGGRDVGYFYCNGKDFFYPYILEGFFFSPDHPTQKELKLAEFFGKQIPQHLSKQYVKEPYDPQLHNLIYSFEHFLTRRFFARWMYSLLFFLNKKRCLKCTKCKICIEVCPVKNIRSNKKGYPVWRQKCILCMHCALKCPEKAIFTALQLPIFRIFMIYNIRRALKNPEIDRVPALIKKGQIVKEK